MRVLVSAIFACCIIALFIVAGCTDILSKQRVGGFGDVPPVQETYTPGPSYSYLKLNYHYRDITNYPEFKNYQGCGECDAFVSEAKSDESHDELLITGIIGGPAFSGKYDPHSDLEVSPFLSPRMSFSGKNYRRVYEWGEGYQPSNSEKAGCQGLGKSHKSGREFETVTQGECKNIQVRIKGIDDDQLEVTVENAFDGPECTSDETQTNRYWGTSMADSVRKDTVDNPGGYHFVCAPYEKGVVQSDETEVYFFGKGPGEQTTRDFSVDSDGVYHIFCSGSKDEVLEPACPDKCDRRSCWVGAAATRHQERFLEIVISPIELATLKPLAPKK